MLYINNEIIPYIPKLFFYNFYLQLINTCIFQ